ncbi:MAG: hypothetical protein WCD37_12540 [Chloroflexia bacterium]
MSSNRNIARKWFAAAATFGAAALTFSAAALAQTPSPGATVSPGATGTASTTSVVTGTVTPGTAIVTGTATVTGTNVATSTRVVPTVPVPSSIYVPGGTGNFPYADAAFKRIWDRTDSVVAEGRIARTWFWGPGPNTPGLLEQYNQGVNKQRLVQYFDKSRMEINNPNGDRSNPFFVTNGLLTVELISGFIQLGDADFVKYRPACIPMSGDFGDTNAPTYFDFQGVSNTQAGDHDAADRTGQNATDTIARGGQVGTDPSKATVPGVRFVRYENKHNIPQVFWDFLNSSGPVKNAQGQVVNERLIDPWNYASGLPISEPYWARATISGTVKDVLIQAYERRALTYVPSNPAGFQVEMANIGQHYFDWRYRNYGYCPADPITTPTPPTPAPSGTVVPGTPGTPAATGTPAPGTPAATGTAGTPGASATATLFVVTRTATGTAQPDPIETPGATGTPVPR